eukprot:GGOE01047841.1.p1 GENE.GGOE01047841.1~~GGOE01047841.1.p1  ORF type:complete len:130 (+),score=7.78 GGOE01047841.1:596-985(+)
MLCTHMLLLLQLTLPVTQVLPPLRRSSRGDVSHSSSSPCLLSNAHCAICCECCASAISVPKPSVPRGASLPWSSFLHLCIVRHVYPSPSPHTPTTLPCEALSRSTFAVCSPLVPALPSPLPPSPPSTFQ